MHKYIHTLQYFSSCCFLIWKEIYIKLVHFATKRIVASQLFKLFGRLF